MAQKERCHQAFFFHLQSQCLAIVVIATASGYLCLAFIDESIYVYTILSTEVQHLVNERK